MTDKIQWIEPAEVTEQRLRNETVPGLHKMFRQCTRYFLLAVPLAVLSYFVNGLVFAGLAVIVLTVLIYQIPFLIWMNIKTARKSGVRYWANSRGIQINRRFYLWKQLEEFNFSHSPLSSDIGCLNIKTRLGKTQHCLSFYQADINQQELQSLLGRHVPKLAQLRHL